MHLLLLVCAAFAGDVFDTVGTETTIGMGGTWARLHATEAGWWFFQVAGGDSWAEDLAPDLSGYSDRDRIALTSRGDLQDVQVERCDDGGWLAVGSASVTTPGDSAYAFRSDVDFTPVGSLTMDESSADRVHQDMVVMCATSVTGALFSNVPEGNGGFGDGSTFIAIDGTTRGSETRLETPSTGTSMAIRPADGRVVAATFDKAGSRDITFTVYEADWSVADTATLTLPEDYALWTQRLMPLGDGWLLVHILRADEFGQPEGEVWLRALDADFVEVDRVRVSPEGSVTNNRPWIARRDDVVAVTYDRDVQPRLTTVTLKAGAVPDDDDGILDTAGDSGDSGDSMDCCKGDAPIDCGCGAGGAPGAAVAGLGIAAVLGRRRR